jgi:septal ring factor EnvC (AmiA/AmiB activator)
LLAALALPASRGAASESAGIDDLLLKLEREEKELALGLERAGAEAEKLEARVVARGRVYVKLSRTGLLPAAGGFDKLTQHARRLEGLRQALERELHRVEQLSRERVRLSKQLAELKDRRIAAEEQHRAMASARGLLMADRDRQLAFERAFSRGTSGDHTAIYGAASALGDPSGPGVGFFGLRGRLPLPLPGRVEVRPATRPGSPGPGLEMLAPANTPVRAVYSARVAFSDDYPDYGLTVILDHGGRHYTVSANLGRLDVRAGDAVPSGGRIGLVGGATPAVLYFEIRSDTDALDPAEWFGL